MGLRKILTKHDENLPQKSLLLVGVLLMFIFSASGAAFYAALSWRNSLYVVYEEKTTPAQHLRDLHEEVADIRYRLAAVLAERLPSVGARKKAEQSLAKIEDLWAKFSDIFKADSAEDKDALQKANRGFETVKKTVQELIVSYNSENRDKLGDLLDEQWPSVITEFSNPLVQLQQNQRNAIRTAYELAEVRSHIFTRLLLALVALAVLVGAYSVYFFTRLKGRMTGIVYELKGMADVLLRTSSEVEMSAKVLQQASDRNSQSIQQTSVAMDQITSMVATTTSGANRSNDLSQETWNAANSGEAVLIDMGHAFRQIEEANQEVLQEMNAVSGEMATILDVFDGIRAKTKVITDIVLQTRLLSFNASVEAARAGEHGRGFAVVADEVNKLAQLSGTASTEISAILQTGLSRVKEIVDDVRFKMDKLSNTAASRTREGSTKSQNAAAVFHEITVKIEEVKTVIADLKRAASEQMNGINEVNRSMDAIGSTTEKNIQAIEGARGAASELTQGAERLQTAVGEIERLFCNAKSKAKFTVSNSTQTRVEFKHVA